MTRLIVALLVVGAVSACVCCVGGLTDTLSPPVAIGLLGTAVALPAAAAIIGYLRLTPIPRAIRVAAAARLDRLVAARPTVARDDRAPAAVTGYRISHIQVDSDNGYVEATVVAAITFDDGLPGALIISLVPSGDEWQISRVEGSGFRLTPE
ncbi:hypothetical protein [Catenuloplanes japonicus]|uniref:hypothetical protein n=1 Tax=Catenuloplanes japonicus TaxID=33876 RepID=UPI000524E015|nr:hypothetical protein [Catenuloplanes japonicus]